MGLFEEMKMKINKKKLLIVAAMSTLLITGCGEGEDKIVEDAPTDAVGYTDDAPNISDVELNSTPTDTKEQTEGEAAADSAADMVNGMKKTLDNMSDTVVDTVDTIKKGASEAADDIGTNIQRGINETQKDLDNALENIKKPDTSSTEGSGIAGSADEGEAEMLDSEDASNDDEVDL